MCTFRNLARKIFTMVLGEAKTCFHVLFLYSIWASRVHKRKMNIGKTRMLKKTITFPDQGIEGILPVFLRNTTKTYIKEENEWNQGCSYNRQIKSSRALCFPDFGTD